jgi:ApaG protein
MEGGAGSAPHHRRLRAVAGHFAAAPQPVRPHAAAGDDDGSDLITDSVVVPLFCMGNIPFEDTARTKNGYTSVALNLFEPRFCLMAKQILDKDAGEKVFGYMETVPPVGADGQDDFSGMEGIMCTVVWWRWLEKQGPGGRVAIDIVAGPRFKVLGNAPSEEEVGIEGAPPLMIGEVEVLDSGADDDDFDLEFDEDFDLDVLGEGFDAAAEPDPEYTWTHSTATTNDVEVRVRSGFQGVDKSANTMVWAYEVTLYNKGELPVKVLSRHWVITDSNGEITEVGPGAHGILGETPTIGPGRAVRYTSSTPLKTEYGTMEGSFEMEVQPAEGAAAEDELRIIEARVARFGLSMDGKPVKVMLELGA